MEGAQISERKNGELVIVFIKGGPQRFLLKNRRSMEKVRLRGISILDMNPL